MDGALRKWKYLHVPFEPLISSCLLCFDGISARCILHLFIARVKYVRADSFWIDVHSIFYGAKSDAAFTFYSHTHICMLSLRAHDNVSAVCIW
jgi:hypothetical protein